MLHNKCYSVQLNQCCKILLNTAKKADLMLVSKRIATSEVFTFVAKAVTNRETGDIFDREANRSTRAQRAKRVVVAAATARCDGDEMTFDLSIPPDPPCSLSLSPSVIYMDCLPAGGPGLPAAAAAATITC